MTLVLKFFIPEKKIVHILELINDIISSRKNSHVKSLARVARKLMACHRSIGHIVKLMLWSLYSNIDKCPTWHWWLQTSEDSLMELRWWRENLAGVHGKDMVTSGELSRFEAAWLGIPQGWAHIWVD